MDNNTAENLNEIEGEQVDDPNNISENPVQDCESQALEINEKSGEDVQDSAENVKTIDEILEELPDSFPEANSVLKCDVFPLIVEMDAGMIDYYTVVLQKKLSVSKQTIKEALKSFKKEMENAASVSGNDNLSENNDKEIDPEIINQAERLALDPKVFKKRIDTVNSLGIINERLNIGVLTMTMDSRLNPSGMKGANVLAAKNTGNPGTGKTATLMAVKQLYSKKCYHLIDNGSAKSIYNMGKDALKHKTLILNEAFSLEGNSSSDTEFTHIVRCLLSEGSVTYQYTSHDADGNKITAYQTVLGPTPLITTSIYGSHEKQLDDRMFSIHSNISSKQTIAVLDIEAKQASGIFKTTDEKEIQIWRVFHDSLEVLDVVIPYAPEIQSFLTQDGELPTSARRAFKRVLVSIKTISLLHQKQRQRDDQGRLIADIRDYALAYQLIDRAFRESLGGGKYIEKRIQVVDRMGPILPKNLARLEEVSGAAITSWSKNWLEKGVLIWVDDQGARIKGKELDKMKHSGKAHLKVVGVNRLPTPYELTKNPDWFVGGELYQFYNLELDSDDDVLTADTGEDADLNTVDDGQEVDNIEDEVDDNQCVKVLNEKAYNEEIKNEKVLRFKHVKEDCEFDNSESLELFEEFNDILKPYVRKENFVA